MKTIINTTATIDCNYNIIHKYILTFEIFMDIFVNCLSLTIKIKQ